MLKLWLTTVEFMVTHYLLYFSICVQLLSIISLPLLGEKVLKNTTIYNKIYI